MTGFTSTRSDRHPPLGGEIRERWMRFGQNDDTLFPALLGLRVEDVRVDYCRLRMPFEQRLLQAGGVVHGGALASLLDAAVVPAIGGGLEPDASFATVDMHVQFIRAVRAGDGAEDVIAEGWVVRRARRTVFCESEAFGADTGRLVAKSVLTYGVTRP